MRSRMVLVAILLMLYIGPSIFIVSYASPTTPTEQNSHKEFSLSADAWLTGWTYRKAVLIDGAAGAGTNYQIMVTIPYDSNMQNDYDDIRFTAFDNITLLDHWRESYTASTTAIFWVEVSANLDSNQIITMYWGNADATSLSNGTATFLFYEDWSSQSIAVWNNPVDQQDGQITFSPTDATQGGYVAKVEGDDADSYMIYTDYTYTAPYALRFRANIEEGSGGTNYGRVGTASPSVVGRAYIQTSPTGETFVVVDDDSNDDSQAMTNAYCDSWIVFEIQRGYIPVNPFAARLLADDVEIEVGSFSPDANTNPVAVIYVKDDEDDVYSDWFVCRKFVSPSPAFASYGDEEDNFNWQLVGEMDIVVVIAIDETGLTIFLIIAGLCLIPLSSMYLVWGGKNAMTTDKFFYGVILFLVGWGLFLGGILV